MGCEVVGNVYQHPHLIEERRRVSMKADYVQWLEREREKLTFKYNKIKSERDTLIDDIAVLRANNERLERENRDFKQENKALRLQANTYFDEWQEAEKQRNEFILYVNLYSTLTNHIRDMKFASPYSYNYIHLVNFIKKLEREDDEI